MIGNEDAEKNIIERVQKEIEHQGGTVETVQKMGPKPFARPTTKRSAAHYVNVIFAAPGKAIGALDTKFHLDNEVFRWQITEIVPEKPYKPRREKKAAAAAAAAAR
ncbi:MAG: 30S ribosomal protein S6 [Verrucomicrobiae bacterium]|nr:30S ribosomal protein S6 [Verrucomicrobiae bacterium]